MTAKQKPDPVHVARFREAYTEVVERTGASAAEMAVALGRSTKTLDNWRATPPRVNDVPFSVIARMAELSERPLEWFAGADLVILNRDHKAVALAETKTEIRRLRTGVEDAMRRLDALLGPQAELERATRPAAPASRSGGGTAKRNRRAKAG